MRYLLFILFLGLAVGNADSQVLPLGDFYTRKADIGFESELFQFNEDKSFRYLKFGCVEVEIGQGNYDVNEDTLVLSFKNNPLLEQFQRIKTTEGSSDKLIVNIETRMSDTRVGSAGVNCYLKTSKQGTITDMDGYAQLIVSKPINSDTLIISFIGYTPIQIPIRTEFDTLNVTTILSNLYFYKDGEKLKFKINRTRKRSFELQRYGKIKVTYEKVTKDRSNQIIEDVLYMHSR